MLPRRQEARQRGAAGLPPSAAATGRGLAAAGAMCQHLHKSVRCGPVAQLAARCLRQQHLGGRAVGAAVRQAAAQQELR